jgi:hydroxymethylpyrimidine/phosphomethylpyrimidine kinase
MKGRVLIVAGSDSGGGAGIQADIKTVTVLGGFAASAITALTAQNTKGVFAIHRVPVDFIRQQMRVVLEDIGADVVKTGMLVDAPTIDAIADELDASAGKAKLVIDPVMVAKGGAELLDPDAVSTLKRRLLMRASIITPNLREAEILCGRAIASVDDMREAAMTMLTLGAQAVLVKGGHLPGAVVSDVLATLNDVEVYEAPRIETTSTHGTGCTLASAIAVGLAQGQNIVSAVERARAYVRRAIESAPGLGSGHGPLNHAHNFTG